ncbi:unnamed protein product [Amoebophrya sp. A120]|nr:unnamed protein product [Amoebophrya sp. A120]|eukprot:GSA120T00025877001.1
MDESLQQLLAQQQLRPEDKVVKAALAGHHDYPMLSNPFLEEAETAATPTPTAGGSGHPMKFDCPFLARAEAARAGDSTTTQDDDVVMRIDSTEQRTSTDDFLEMNDICSKAGGHNQDEDHQLLKAGDKQLSSTTACSTDECCEEFLVMSGNKEKTLSHTTSTSEFLEAAIGDYIKTKTGEEIQEHQAKQGGGPDQNISKMDPAAGQNEKNKNGGQEAKVDGTNTTENTTIEGGAGEATTTSSFTFDTRHTTSTSEFLEAAIGDYIKTSGEDLQQQELQAGGGPDQNIKMDPAGAKENNNGGQAKPKVDGNLENRNTTIEGGEATTTSSTRAISPTGARLYVDTVEQGQTQWDARIEAAHCRYSYYVADRTSVQDARKREREWKLAEMRKQADQMRACFTQKAALPAERHQGIVLGDHHVSSSEGAAAGGSCAQKNESSSSPKRCLVREGSGTISFGKDEQAPIKFQAVWRRDNSMDLDNSSQVNNNEKSGNSCPGSGSENVVDSATTTTTTTAKNDDEDDHVKKEKAEESTAAAAGQHVDEDLGDEDHDNSSKKKLKPLQMPAAVSKAVPAGALLPGGPKKGTTTSPTITTGKSAAPQLSPPPGSSPVLTPPVHQPGMNNPAGGGAARGGPAWHMMNKGGAAGAPAGPATSPGSSSYGPDSYNSNNMQNANDGATFVPGKAGPQHVAAPPTGGPYGSGKSRNYPHGMNKGHHQHHNAMKGGPAPHYQQHHFKGGSCASFHHPHHQHQQHHPPGGKDVNALVSSFLNQITNNQAGATSPNKGGGGAAAASSSMAALDMGLMVGAMLQQVQQPQIMPEQQLHKGSYGRGKMNKAGSYAMNHGLGKHGQQHHAGTRFGSSLHGAGPQPMYGKGGPGSTTLGSPPGSTSAVSSSCALTDALVAIQNVLNSTNTGTNNPANNSVLHDIMHQQPQQVPQQHPSTTTTGAVSSGDEWLSNLVQQITASGGCNTTSIAGTSNHAGVMEQQQHNLLVPGIAANAAGSLTGAAGLQHQHGRVFQQGQSNTTPPGPAGLAGANGNSCTRTPLNNSRGGDGDSTGGSTAAPADDWFNDLIGGQ